MMTLHTIHAGEFFITSQPTVISTVLGSCVAVCLWDRETKTGAMNHFLLPGDADHTQLTDMNKGATSVEALIQMMSNRNVKVSSIEAKIFGGCNSLYDFDCFRIGERNIEIATEVLKRHGITVLASHVGGNRGRKISFNTATGRVRMTILPPVNSQINERPAN